MARLVENIDELIQEVGPRPVGTQQEHQAAELIAARLDEVGLRVDIEEFPCARNLGWVRVLYFALSSIGAAIVVFSPSIRIIGVIAVLIGAILLLLDYLGKSPVFSVFNNSLSQNVIARHLPPGSEPSARSRKVIVLAHYDSARTMVQAAPPLAPYFTRMRRIMRIMAIAVVLLALLLMIPFPLDIIVRIISGVTVLAALPLALGMVAEIINFFMPFSQGANCNGSGVGVLYGLAQTLATGEDVASMRSTTRQGSARRGRRGSRAAGRSADANGVGAAATGSRRSSDDGSRAGAAGRSRRERAGQERSVGRDGLGQTGRERAVGRDSAVSSGGRDSLGQTGEILTTGAFVGSAAAGSAAAGSAAAAGLGSLGYGGAGGAVGGAMGANATGASAEILDSRVSVRAPATSDYGIGTAADAASLAMAGATATGGSRTQGLSAVEARERDMAANVRPRESGRRRTAVQAAGDSHAAGLSATGQGFGVEPAENKPTQQVFGVDVPVDALTDSTVSPFVKPRMTAAEAERQAELERAAAQRQQQAAEPQRDNSEKPAWFLKAKQNAEKKAHGHDAADAGITRSRFADVPVSGEEARVRRATKAVQPGTELEQIDIAADIGKADGAAGIVGDIEGKALDAAAAAAGVAAAAAAASAAGAAARTVAPTPETSLDGQGLPSPEAAVDSRLPQPPPLVASVAAMPGDGGAAAAQDERASRKPAVITVNPDLSGIDRQAFKVLPAEQQSGQTVIVPAEVEGILPGAGDAAGGAGVGDGAGFGGGGQPGLGGTAASGAVGVQPGDGSEPHKVNTQNASRPLSRLRNRLNNLPNLSSDNTGNIPMQQAAFNTALVSKEELFAEDSSPISSTGSFIPLGTTGIMKPVGDELLQYADGGDIYVQDADDTAIEEHYSDEGHYSAPELVNIPDSRVKSFLGSVGDRLAGRKKEKLEDSPSSWLGVDQDFNARREGHDIGTWNNFGSDGDDSWNGGAYGGDSYDDDAQAMMELSKELLDKEVWLVALGASESRNAGLDNLFANHGNEIKNALFINLLGVGAGDLVFTISEGEHNPLQTDHRMQNLIGSAAQNMSIPIAPVEFNAFSTDGTQALRQGGRAISIIGMGRHLPVGWKWSDDDISRLEEDNLLDVVALVLEAIKSS